MRRAAGVAVVVAGAVLGAGSGVLANDRVHGPGRRDAAAVTDGSTPGDRALGGPSTPTGTTSTTGGTSPTAVPTAAVTSAQLLTVADLGRAGWDTSALVARTQVGEGALSTGVCQRDSLVASPGAGTRVRVDLTGRWTSAHEVTATFASPPRARAAYDALRAGLAACRTGSRSPSGARLTVGPEVAVVVPGASSGAASGTDGDRGVWSTVVPAAGAAGTATGTSGATPRAGVMGVLLVGQRVAVVQVDDPAPRASTVAAILTSAAGRLAR